MNWMIFRRIIKVILIKIVQFHALSQAKRFCFREKALRLNN